jgi:hypothetical protein
MLRAENRSWCCRYKHMLEEPPEICVCMYSTTALEGGRSGKEALRSVGTSSTIQRTDWMLVMIDNYSVDGAFEYVRDWLEQEGKIYEGYPY